MCACGPHPPMPAHAIASTHPQPNNRRTYLPAFLAFQYSPVARDRGAVFVCEVLVAPGSFPPITTNPDVALLETTVILINKHICGYCCVNLGTFCGKL